MLDNKEKDLQIEADKNEESNEQKQKKRNKKIQKERRVISK